MKTLQQEIISIPFSKFILNIIYVYFEYFKVICFVLILLFITPSISLDKYDYINVELKTAQKKYDWLSYTLQKEIKLNSYKYNLSPLLVCALIQKESRGRNVAGRRNRNGTKDYGYMQVNSVHIEDVRLLYKPKVNISIGCKYLYLCIRKAKNRIKEAVRLYNAGLNSMKCDLDGNYFNKKYVETIYTEWVKNKNLI